MIADLNSADAKDAGPLSHFAVSAGKRACCVIAPSALVAILINERIE